MMVRLLVLYKTECKPKPTKNNLYPLQYDNRQLTEIIDMVNMLIELKHVKLKISLKKST